MESVDVRQHNNNYNKLHYLIILYSGYVFILAPYLYYYFLKMRYTSRRNPSVRSDEL